jgi:hypothetical protein
MFVASQVVAEVRQALGREIAVRRRSHVRAVGSENENGEAVTSNPGVPIEGTKSAERKKLPILEPGYWLGVASW